MKGFPDLPPIWWAGSMLLVYIAEILVPALHFDVTGLRVAATVLLVLAIGLILWSAIQFWRKKTPIEPHHTPKTLIVEGPYRVSRNPIYLALVMITVAAALSRGSILGFGVAFGLWWVLDRRFASVEEAVLQQTFGAAATDYLAKTRRWV